MERPEVYVLSLHRWQLFGSLTFRSGALPERLRVSMFKRLLRETARDFGLYFPSLVWALRHERGEIGNRMHCHCLIHGLPQDAIQERTCLALKVRWEQLGGGFARMSVFDQALDGIDYLTKCLGMDLAGGDCYESAKFGQGSCDLTLSAGVWRPSRFARGKRLDRTSSTTPKVCGNDKRSRAQRRAEAEALIRKWGAYPQRADAAAALRYRT